MQKKKIGIIQLLYRKKLKTRSLSTTIEGDVGVDYLVRRTNWKSIPSVKLLNFFKIYTSHFFFFLAEYSFIFRMSDYTSGLLGTFWVLWDLEGFIHCRFIALLAGLRIFLDIPLKDTLCYKKIWPFPQLPDKAGCVEWETSQITSLPHG